MLTKYNENRIFVFVYASVCPPFEEAANDASYSVKAISSVCSSICIGLETEVEQFEILQ